MDTTNGEPTLDVGYNKAFGGVLLGLAILCLVLGVMVSNPMTVVIGAMNTFIGILYRGRPYFVVGRGTIELKNLLGMTMRRYQFTDAHPQGSLAPPGLLADRGALEVAPDGKSVYLTDATGARTRLKLTRWLADGGDWRRFLGRIQAHAFE